MKHELVIGTRGSGLALAQTRYVAAELERLNPGLTVSWTVIRTLGDRNLEQPLAALGDRGLFVTELETALLEGRVHLAVHSLKDLPSQMPRGLDLHAVCAREDPRDAVIPRADVPPATDWSGLLRQGAVVGTSSLRRQAQLLHHRPDLHIVNLRGNVDTRLRKLEEGQMDACVLACAGLDRLGLFPSGAVRVPVEDLVPAPGQGALAIQGRSDDAETRGCCAPLDDPVVRAATSAERRAMELLGGGCQVPLGVHARPVPQGLEVLACVGSVDGKAVLRSRAVGPLADPQALASRVVDDLKRQGVDDLLAAILRGVR